MMNLGEMKQHKKPNSDELWNAPLPNWCSRWKKCTTNEMRLRGFKERQDKYSFKCEIGKLRDKEDLRDANENGKELNR